MKNLAKWYLIESGAKSGFYNMAADEEMLNLDKPALRIYAFKPNCITMGYFMKTENTINFDFIRKNNIDVTRRITGGKAVLHANELTFSLCAPLKTFGKSVISAYKTVSLILKKVYSKIGIHTNNYSSQNTGENHICFTEKSRYEITSNNKKIAGFAQKKCSDKILQHCSVPFEIDYSLLLKSFKNNERISKDFLKQNMSCINELTDENISYEKFSNLLINAFKQEMNIDFTRYEFSEVNLTNINNKINCKYIMPCWIKQK
jgi:lipoate-protein ligase A